MADDEHHVLATWQAGIDDHLVRPVRGDELVAAVTAAMTRTERERRDHRRQGLNRARTAAIADPTAPSARHDPRPHPRSGTTPVWGGTGDPSTPTRQARPVQGVTARQPLATSDLARVDREKHRRCTDTCS